MPRPGASVPRPGGNGARQWRTTTPPAAAVGTHSSLLEFDTWRLALSSHLCPNKVLGAGKYAQPARLLGIEGFTPLLVVIQSEGLGSKCYTRIEAFLWHPSGKRFNKSNPQNSQNKMDFEVALKREMKLHFRPGQNISGQLTSTSLEMHSGEKSNKCNHCDINHSAKKGTWSSLSSRRKHLTPINGSTFCRITPRLTALSPQTIRDALSQAGSNE